MTATTGAIRCVAEDVAVGDEILFLGDTHIIREIRPYAGTVGDLDTSGWRVAVDASGWAVTLIPGQGWWVAAEPTGGAS